MVARRAHNPKVTGSSPVPATKKPGHFDWVFLCLNFSRAHRFDQRQVETLNLLAFLISIPTTPLKIQYVTTFVVDQLIIDMKRQYYTYVLHSKYYDKIYIGYTSNLEERMKSHNELGKKGYTRRYRPWTIIHLEAFDSKSQAMNREKQLKSARGRRFIREEVLKI